MFPKHHKDKSLDFYWSSFLTESQQGFSQGHFPKGSKEPENPIPWCLRGSVTHSVGVTSPSPLEGMPTPIKCLPVATQNCVRYIPLFKGIFGYKAAVYTLRDILTHAPQWKQTCSQWWGTALDTPTDRASAEPWADIFSFYQVRSFQSAQRWTLWWS